MTDTTTWKTVHVCPAPPGWVNTYADSDGSFSAEPVLVLFLQETADTPARHR